MNDSKLKNLAAQIFRYFHNKDKPPADEIQIPIKAIKQDFREKGIYYATVRFYVNHTGMIFRGKKHNEIRIKFNVDEVGRFLANTWEYV